MAVFLYMEKEQTSKLAWLSEAYDLTVGIAGQTYINQTTSIVSDVTLDQDFNQKVDIYSLLPVMTVPIVIRVEMTTAVIGLLQVTMRERAKYRMKQKMCLANSTSDYLQEHQYLIEQFAEVIRQAYKFVYRIIGDHQMNVFTDKGGETFGSFEEQKAFDRFMKEDQEETLEIQPDH